MNINPAAFYGLSAFLIVTAMLVTRLRDIFHSGLFLIAAFMSIAGLYLLLGAEFLAGVQVLIYIGAISILLIFGIMLTSRMKSKDVTPFGELRAAAPFLSVLSFILVSGVILATSWPAGDKAFENNVIEELGKAFMKTHLLPFELVSLIILAALVGAVIIARKEER
jgi:NADH-quinone oxidoreductase subunit J